MGPVSHLRRVFATRTERRAQLRVVRSLRCVLLPDDCGSLAGARGLGPEGGCASAVERARGASDGVRHRAEIYPSASGRE